MDQLQPGDTVQLKSGGEVMTIESIDEYGANCVWFENKKVQRHTFDPVVLNKFKMSVGIG
jgi:uncharacterized protein YodC (DUF2158 family)